MRRILIGLVAMALVLGLFAGAPAEAKVYKMSPEERAAALKEKKKQRKKAKKSGKPVPGQDQGGWVEVKPGEKIAKKNRASKVDELSKASKSKTKKVKKATSEATGKTSAAPKRSEKGKESVAQGSETAKKATTVDAKTKQSAAKKTGRKTATHGDRLVTRDFVGERKVSASSAEVRRAVSAPAKAPAAVPAQPLAPAPVAPSAPASVPAPAAAPASKPDGLPRQDKAPVAPQVRQEVQPGPVDAARPVSTESKAGEGRF